MDSEGIKTYTQGKNQLQCMYIKVYIKCAKCICKRSDKKVIVFKKQ